MWERPGEKKAVLCLFQCLATVMTRQRHWEPVKTECCKLLVTPALSACCYVDLTTSGTLQSSDLWISSLQLELARPQLSVFAEI